MFGEKVEDVLYRLSIEFVRENNSMLGEFTYDDLLSDIHLSALRRNFIGDLQIFSAEYTNYGWEATFQFSPVYLNRRVDMLYAGVGEMKWKIILPDSTIKTGVTNENKADVDEEILSKSAEGRVEIIHFEPGDNFNLDEFAESFLIEED